MPQVLGTLPAAPAGALCTAQSCSPITAPQQQLPTIPRHLPQLHVDVCAHQHAPGPALCSALACSSDPLPHPNGEHRLHPARHNVLPCVSLLISPSLSSPFSLSRPRSARPRTRGCTFQHRLPGDAGMQGWSKFPCLQTATATHLSDNGHLAGQRGHPALGQQRKEAPKPNQTKPKRGTRLLPCALILQPLSPH